MDFELRAAREKLEREQKERKEKARIKLQRENKARAEATRVRDAIEAEQRTRRLHAAQAQLKANREMEENLQAGQGIVFYRILEAVPYQGYGDKIKLPPSCFTELSDQGALDKGPMYFRLTKLHVEESITGQYQETTHSGVLEFTAAEGSVELPSHVWSNLIPATSHNGPPLLIEVRYVRLSKGNYAKLQPDSKGFSDLPNHKAILETSLRQHATLSQGDLLTVKHGDLSYTLRVLELKPSSAVSILETDVEVDIVEPENYSGEMEQQHILTPLVLGDKAESGFVEEGKYNYYKFSVDSANMVSAGSENFEVKIEVEIDGDGSGDTDLYVSRHPVLFPTQNQHEWSSHNVGSKVLILSPHKDQSQSLPVSATYSIGIFGFKGSTKYRISVATIQGNNSGRMVGEDAVSSSAGQVEGDRVECRNCRHYILSKTIALHEAYCIRHNVVCQHEGCGIVLRKEEAPKHVHCAKCGSAFQREELDKHMKVFHEPLPCPCGVILEKEDMVLHQTSNCPLRLVTCRFCGDMVQAGTFPTDARDRLRGLSEHESMCGSRTAPCETCGRAVMLKEMEIHRFAVHQQN